MEIKFFASQNIAIKAKTWNFARLVVRRCAECKWARVVLLAQYRAPSQCYGWLLKGENGGFNDGGSEAGMPAV